MAGEPIIIAGDYGTGKSTSGRNLPPEDSLWINVLGKPLPFPGWKKQWTYKTLNKGKDDEVKVNMVNTADPKKVVQVMQKFHDARPNLKYIIVDDTTYLMTSEFMRRRKEASYEKWADMAFEIWDALRTPVENFRDGVKVFFMWHIEEVETGDILGSGTKQICKTLGNSLKKNVGIEGIPRIVLFTHVDFNEDNPKDRYKFVTNSTGSNTAKSPMEMFPNLLISNDLKAVADRIDEYDNGNI